MITLAMSFFMVIFISFICSILESILLSITPSHISYLKEHNPNIGKKLEVIKEEINDSISSILIVNTFANTLGATFIGIQTQKVFNTDDTLILIITIALTFSILFFSEIIPKTIGAIYWKKLSIPATYLLYYLKILVKPLTIITNVFTKYFLKENKESTNITREDILHSIQIGEENGQLNNLESDIIENTLQIKNIKINEILTPRRVVFAVEQHMVIDELLNNPKIYEFTRIPVFDEHIDQIVGVVFTKDILKQAILNKSISILDIMRPIRNVNENIPVLTVMKKLISHKEHMFYVVDGFDQTTGIVTLEDCIETVLGLEIMDEVDMNEDMRELASSLMKQERKSRK